MGHRWVICFERELFVLHLLVLILKPNTIIAIGTCLLLFNTMLMIIN